MTESQFGQFAPRSGQYGFSGPARASRLALVGGFFSSGILQTCAGATQVMIQTTYAFYQVPNSRLTFIQLPSKCLGEGFFSPII